MKRSKFYALARFSADVLRDAGEALKEGSDVAWDKRRDILKVTTTNGVWFHDEEGEFFTDYRASSGSYFFRRTTDEREIWIEGDDHGTVVQVEAPSRSLVNRVFDVFEKHFPESQIPQPPAPTPTVFIGHGRDALWRELKDHLQDKHGLKVEAYEIGARAGHAVRDVLERMLERSSFAVLVMTGEDETADGSRRARQNVIHETGLFQGRLGFTRAVVLVEAGTEMFSNMEGIEQIRFSQGNIKETFGEVLATIRREFVEGPQ